MNRRIIALAFMILLLFSTVFATDFTQLEKAAARQKIRAEFASDAYYYYKIIPIQELYCGSIGFCSELRLRQKFPGIILFGAEGSNLDEIPFLTRKIIRDYVKLYIEELPKTLQEYDQMAGGLI